MHASYENSDFTPIQNNQNQLSDKMQTNGSFVESTDVEQFQVQDLTISSTTPNNSEWVHLSPLIFNDPN